VKQLLVEGLNHRRAPLEVRERVFITPDVLRARLEAVAARPGVGGATILSTCNRTEFYVTAEDPRVASAAVREQLDDVDPSGGWRTYSFRLEGTEAVAHLFRVPAGLDSAIVGEGQVLAQFKAAHGESRTAGTLDGQLDFLLRRAITAAKRVRTETAISRGPVGFGQAAVAQAAEILGGLKGKSALLVGAGKIAGSTARSFASAGVTDLYFSSRTQGRASALAGDLGGAVTAVVVSHADLERIASHVDVVVTSTSSPDHLIGVEMAQDLVARRAGRPLFILDLAVPRDVDPAVGAVPGVHLFNIDDLAATVTAGRGRRDAEVPRAEAIVADEVGRAATELARREADPAVAALTRDFETRRRLVASGVAAEASLERAARSLSANLLHVAIEFVRESGGDPAALAVARALLGLPPAAQPDLTPEPAENLD